MNSEELTEKVLSRSVVHPGVFLRLEHWQVALPNGETAPREIARLPGASAVVALDADNNLLLVRQHRVAVGRITLELPAGKLDSPEEDPFLCAQRELEEETGYRADSWSKLTTIEPSPAFCTEQIHLYQATGLKAGASHPDEDEFLAVTRIPLKEAAAMVMNGKIMDGKTAVGILMAAGRAGLSLI